MRSTLLVILLATSAAVNGSPVPQGVTAQIAPSAAVPKECIAKFPGVFGIGIRPIAPGMAKREAKIRVSHTNTGKSEVLTSSASTMAAVSQIADGQVQAPTMPVVTQISDGQVQAPTSPILPIITQISNGQIQAPTQSLVTVTVRSTTTMSKVFTTRTSDRKVRTYATTSMIKSIKTSLATVQASVASAMVKSGTTNMPSGPSAATACQTKGNLELKLRDGVLTDAAGRTGYIASNFQFQFDDPPQAGSIYTSGFSTCSNGSLALGGSALWWQCRSGNFFNLYDRYWAPQCSPVELMIVRLVEC